MAKMILQMPLGLVPQDPPGPPLISNDSFWKASATDKEHHLTV